MRLRPEHALELAILGALALMPLTTGELVTVVRRLGGAHFQPTTEVFAVRLGALASRGLVERLDEAPDGSDALLRTTAAGIAHARRLLLPGQKEPDPMAATFGLGAANGTMALKVCFLDLLEPEARPRVVRDLIARHDRELARARAALARCPCRGAFTRRWLAHDVERQAAELRWLQELVADEAGADAEVTAF